jgi:hypothetical protein
VGVRVWQSGLARLSFGMGVHGLTLYLRKNKRILAKSFEYPSSSTQRASIVVDGRSFIYELFHRSNLPWVYGGEYKELESLIVTVVQAWINAGLKVYMVFDGASPLCWLYHLTDLISRRNA